MTATLRRYLAKGGCILLALFVLLLLINIVGVLLSYPHYRMTFGVPQSTENEHTGTRIDTCIMMGNCGFLWPNTLFLDFFMRGYKEIQRTVDEQYQKYLSKYGSGSQIFLSIEQDDHHIRMKYSGYGVLPGGVREPVERIFDFTAPWPWILFGYMPALTSE